MRAPKMSAGIAAASLANQGASITAIAAAKAPRRAPAIALADSNVPRERPFLPNSL